MKINALLIDDIDNVVTCVAEVSAGSDVYYRKGSEILSLKAEDEEVLKYGEMIGRTNQPIARGHWVSDKNICSVPRDYDSEFVSTGGRE